MAIQGYFNLDCRQTIGVFTLNNDQNPILQQHIVEHRVICI